FFSQGIQDSTFSMICSDFLLMIPFVVLFPFLMVLSALLQSNQQFVLPALSQILFNMLWFLILFVLPFISVGVGEGGFYLAGGLTVAALINAMVLVPFTIKFWRLPISASKRKIKKKSINLYIKRITNQLLPFLLILILSQGLLFIERRFAAHLGEGTPAALNYAYRLVQFPIWVVVAAISTVLLPDLSNKVSRKQDHLVQNQMKKTILFIVVLSFFCSFGLFLLREPIISILFERGAFTALSVQNTSDLLEGYSWAIFGQSMTFIVLRYFTAYGKLLWPLIISIISFIISWVFDYAMIPLIGARALGYGASIGAFFNGLVFLFILFKEWGIFHEWYNGNRKGFFSHHSGL
ncbi:MAG: murein biosynthesis integral membrane protein MurJ, partial [Tuberibacillus sp.]